MTKECRSTNDKWRSEKRLLCNNPFVLRASSFFRHSCFVIRHFPEGVVRVGTDHRRLSTRQAFGHGQTSQVWEVVEPDEAIAISP